MSNRTTHRWTVHPDRGRRCELCDVEDPPLGEWCPPCPYPTKLSKPTPTPIRYIYIAIGIAVAAALGFLLIIALFALRDGLIRPK
jgi:hypothetical protein